MLSCFCWSSSLLRNIVTDEATYTTVCICRFIGCVTVIGFLLCFVQIVSAKIVLKHSILPWPENFLARFSVSLKQVSLESRAASPIVASACGRDMSTFGQHQNFPPRAGKTSGTQGTSICAFSRVLRLACDRLEL